MNENLPVCLLLAALVAPAPALALDCGKSFTFPNCSGRDYQYAGGFKPRVGYGGFGGGAC